MTTPMTPHSHEVTSTNQSQSKLNENSDKIDGEVTDPNAQVTNQQQLNNENDNEHEDANAMGDTEAARHLELFDTALVVNKITNDKEKKAYLLLKIGEQLLPDLRRTQRRATSLTRPYDGCYKNRVQEGSGGPHDCRTRPSRSTPSGYETWQRTATIRAGRIEGHGANPRCKPGRTRRRALPNQPVEPRGAQHHMLHVEAPNRRRADVVWAVREGEYLSVWTPLYHSHRQPSSRTHLRESRDERYG